MNRKTNVPELYLPSTSKNYTYYPIQQRKIKNPNPDRTPPTIRIDRQSRDRELECLRHANEEFREREQIYIEKLMTLEEGLQNQHRQFVKLQELYTQLFQSYKQKELEIAELQFKYRETSRRHYAQKINESRPLEQCKTTLEEGLRQLETVKREKDWIARETQLLQLNETLTQKLLTMNQNYEKVLQEIANSKGKEKPQTKAPGNQQILEEIEQWKKKLEAETQVRLKLQYENQFLKDRNKDMENQREQLQKLLAYKQKEIGRLREEKIHIHRQTSQKLMSRSHSSSSRVLKINHTNTNRDQEGTKDSKVNLTDQSISSSDSSRLQQYFSFSREKREKELEENLPSFPAELEIDSLINQHKQ